MYTYVYICIQNESRKTSHLSNTFSCGGKKKCLKQKLFEISSF